MTTKKYNFSKISLLTAMILLLGFSCTRDFEDLEPATFPANGDVFIDGFSAGLNYGVFSGASLTAFDVDTDVKYDGASSMRFAVPNDGDPLGSYAAGAFFTSTGRDLSGFDALTFWARASQPVTIAEIGFGNDFGEGKYTVSYSNITVNSNWKKYIIPIPDPSKLTQERGLLYYVATPDDGDGYTFWMDEVKFEKLGTLANPRAAILNGQDQVVSAATGDELKIEGTSATFNMPTGTDQTIGIAPAYLNYVSSETSLATVNDEGVVTVIDSGQVVITAQLGDIMASGSLTIGGTGQAVGPTMPAPVPTVEPDSVISMFSNAYENVAVDVWNTYWEGSTAETFDIQIDGDDVKQYKNLNFVGIEFTSQTINATGMSHFHMDIWTPDPTDLPASFKIKLVDFGANNTYDGGGDDSEHEVSFTSPTLATGTWISLDMPLSSFLGLTARANLAQLVLAGDLSNVYVDNVYFYTDGTGGSGGSGPQVAAPTPSQAPGNVISVFSDAYSNLEGTNFYPDWGQTTSVSEVSIQGNNTLVYAGFNYQGIELAGSTDISGMDFLHIDFWTANSTDLNAFLISTGPVEAFYSLSVPTSGWGSVDIPLSSFSPVDLADLIQLKFDGNGDIYMDNIYFYSGSGGGDTPTEAAPTPTDDPGSVISIFSDAFTNVAGTNFYPDWGQATVVSEVPVAGNNTLLYTGLNYQGVELGSSQDVSGLTNLHIDFWTATSTTLEVFLISPGPVEVPVALTVPTSGWGSVDIPLSSFAPVDLADVFQLKFVGDGTVYLDNIYFRD